MNKDLYIILISSFFSSF